MKSGAYHELGLDRPTMTRSERQADARREHDRNEAQRRGGFVKIYADIMESPARMALTLRARQLLDVMTLKHLKVGWKNGGVFKLTEMEIVAAGMKDAELASPKRELETLGWIEVITPGHGSPNLKLRRGGMYRLPWLPDTLAGEVDDPNALWRRFRTVDEAKAAVAAALATERVTKGSRKDAAIYAANDAVRLRIKSARGS